MYINFLQQIASWAICKAEGQGKAYGSGDGTAQDCIFPFKYKGKTYTACVTPSDGQKPYCATKVDSNGNLVEGKWARCNKYCKTDKGEMLFYVYLSHISYIYIPMQVYLTHVRLEEWTRAIRAEKIVLFKIANFPSDKMALNTKAAHHLLKKEKDLIVLQKLMKIII